MLGCISVDTHTHWPTIHRILCCVCVLLCEWVCSWWLDLSSQGEIQYHSLLLMGGLHQHWYYISLSLQHTHTHTAFPVCGVLYMFFPWTDILTQTSCTGDSEWGYPCQEHLCDVIIYNSVASTSVYIMTSSILPPDQTRALHYWRLTVGPSYYNLITEHTHRQRKKWTEGRKEREREKCTVLWNRKKGWNDRKGARE